MGRWGGHRGWTSEPGDGERCMVRISEPVRRTLAFTLGRTPDCCVEKSRGDRLGGSEPGKKGEDLLGGGR